jgi:hypothetical protein
MMRLAGLSRERLREYQFSQLLQDGLELGSLLFTQHRSSKATDVGNADKFQLFLDKLVEFSGPQQEGATMGSFEELVVKSASPMAIVRLLALASFNDSITTHARTANTICLNVLGRMDNQLLSAAGPVVVSRLFDEFVIIFDTVMSPTLAAVRKLSLANGAFVIDFSLVTGVCTVLARVLNHYNNKKKLFQLFIGKVLPACLDLLNYTSVLPSELVRTLHELIKNGALGGENDIEEIANVSVLSGTSKQKQSYFVGLFECVGSYCDVQRNGDADQLKSDHTWNYPVGIASLLSVYGSCSLHLYNSSVDASAGSKSNASTSSVQLWRRHCFRVMHFGFQLIDILEASIAKILSQSIATSSSIVSGCLVWLSRSKACLVAQLRELLPGSLPQHKSLDAFVERLKKLAGLSMQRLCRDQAVSAVSMHVSKEDSRGTDKSTPSKKKKAKSESHSQKQSISEEMITEATSTISGCVISELSVLKSLMLIDHRAVLECLDHGTDTTSMDIDESAKTELAEIEHGDWAVKGTQFLVQALVDCVSPHNVACVNVFSQVFGASVNEGDKFAKFTADEALRASRLELFQLLVNTFSDLRRLDVLYQVLLSANNDDVIDPRHSLGDLLSDTCIQSRLSRVVMSLSSVQMLNLWNNLSVEDHRDGKSVRKPHNCAAPLIRATVGAALASSEINAASISLPATAKMLMQVLQHYLTVVFIV